MKAKIKWLAIFEAFVVVILLIALTNSYTTNNKIKNKPLNSGLLSPRIYSGHLEPKSFMVVNFAPLKKDIQNYIAKDNLNASVYVENFRNGAFMGINEKTGFFPTSLNKLPVAILIMKKIEEGNLSFDAMLKIQESDRKIGSGELYKTKEKQLPLRILLEKLLRESDNTALSVLLHYLNTQDLQFLVDYYGLDITVDYQEQQRQKHPNLISPKAMSALYSSLYFSTVLEPQNSEYLLSLLKDSNFPIKEIADLPDDVTVAHKFGGNYYDANQFFHECGIIYIDESRIFYCIMTEGLEEEKAAEAIGVIINKTYSYVVEAKAGYEAYKGSKR